MMIDSVLHYTYFWSLPGERGKLPMQMRPVLVVGYREVTSMEHLRHKQCCSIPYDMFEKYQSYDVYDLVPSCCMQSDIDIDEQVANSKPEHKQFQRYEVVGEPITMTEYFALIGYDYKTKKFNGLTMKKIIANYMRERRTPE